jgi:hypothetical protein
MVQVVDKLCCSGFITGKQMEAHLSPPSNHDVTDQISGLGRWVNNVARHFTDPDGALAKMDGRIKSVEDRWAGDSIEQGGKFCNIGAVSAWVQTFKDKDLFWYCFNMVALLMLCADPYKTIAEGMATAAAAHKAEYNSLTEAQISLFYSLTFPKNLMKKHDKEKHVYQMVLLCCV